MFRAKLYSLLILFVSVVAQASGGSSAGNGGGGWTCRNADGSIRWIELADLVEIKWEAFDLQNYVGDYATIVAQVEQKLNDAKIDRFRSSSSESKFSDYVQNLHGLRESANVIYTDQTLPIINDALYYATPAAETCSGGRIHYEQIVNYNDDNHILVSSQLFSALSDPSKAALVIHEAVYAFFRNNKGDTDSLRSRIITGLAFTTQSSKRIHGKLREMDAPGGAPLFEGDNKVVVRKAKNDGSLEPIAGAELYLSAFLYPCTAGGNYNGVEVYPSRTDLGGVGIVNIPDKNGTCRGNASIEVRIGGVGYKNFLPILGWALKLKADHSSSQPLSCEVFSSHWLRNIFVTCVDKTVTTTN